MRNVGRQTGDGGRQTRAINLAVVGVLVQRQSVVSDDRSQVSCVDDEKDRSGSIFIQICVVGYNRRIFCATEWVLTVQGRSGSSKVVDFGTSRKRVNDLVGHCDCGPILHRF